MRPNIFLASASLVAILSGCASKSEEIVASYVSPMQYQSYSCSQLAQENNRIASRLNQMTAAQDSRASDDAVATGVAIVLFWPAAFFIQGDDMEPEIARLKGEYEAIEQAANRQTCNNFEQRSPAAL